MVSASIASSAVMRGLSDQLTTLEEPSLEDVVLTAIGFANDTDTTTAVAGGLAGIWFGFAGIYFGESNHNQFENTYSYFVDLDTNLSAICRAKPPPGIMWLAISAPTITSISRVMTRSIVS
jgi:hypothetical protein